MSEPAKPERMTVPDLMMICKGCGGERMVYFDPPLVGAPELIEWLEGRTPPDRHPGPTPCRCGAKTCDVRIRMPLEPPRGSHD